jgi:hypothetical protein
MFPLKVSSFYKLNKVLGFTKLEGTPLWVRDRYYLSLKFRILGMSGL